MNAAEHRPLRADRLLTLWLDAARRRTSAGGIPILMYHSIADDTDVERHPYYRTVTSPATFARHMAQLHASGYRAVSLEEAARAIDAPTQAGVNAGRPSKLVVLTFDDGFADFLTHAFPHIAARGYTATVFVASAYIDRDFVDGRRCLSTTEIAALARAGIEFGSHTATHPQLHDVADDVLHRELTASRERIEAVAGRAVRSFSYPYRFPEEDRPFVERLRVALRRAGYDAGVTTTIGVSRASDERLFLRRLPINDLDDDRLFDAKLRGAYDWLHAAQLAFKTVRRACVVTSRAARQCVGSRA